ncbi:CPXCG motif-containing cysteine-rich protein [Microvenator marinus]|uniref:CPXCG motif-containing cysteine-rich protein n=1 Tax=Microvenator marinus TaxID=2600177 RepID=A0A5B8XVM3_9DELT|nr:CPXCG motif-containing cysteine-rich protein [Microvenator marinus]
MFRQTAEDQRARSSSSLPKWLEIASDERGEMVQDCEVCCRPWRIRVSWTRDHEPQVMVDCGQ